MNKETNFESCQICEINAPLKVARFDSNIGMLFRRKHISTEGKLCKNCINKYFWNHAYTNLFLGWWGAISFYMTFWFLLRNTYVYLGCTNLKYGSTDQNSEVSKMGLYKNKHFYNYFMEWAKEHKMVFVVIFFIFLCILYGLVFNSN